MTTTLQPATDGPVEPTNGAETRGNAIDALIVLLHDHALSEITLQSVADLIGTTEAEMEEQFGHLEGLVAAALQVWCGRRMDVAQRHASQNGAVAYLRKLLEISSEDQTISRLVLASASLVVSADAPTGVPLQQLWVQFHASVQRALTRDIECGREPVTMVPAHGTEQLLGLYEGLQFQWLHRPHMDLLAAWDRATTRLRNGWSQPYSEPIWSI